VVSCHRLIELLDE
jgi:hypothetical protein